jgi:hypothetical protein
MLKVRRPAISAQTAGRRADNADGRPPRKD